MKDREILPYVVATILSTVIGVDKFGFEWFGFKAIFFAVGLVFVCTTLVYIIEKFKD